MTISNVNRQSDNLEMKLPKSKSNTEEFDLPEKA
jgi:hypothetical protein